MKLASWNVNGIRACEKKGFWQWIEQNDFDIIALQEIKISLDQIKELNPTPFVKKNYTPYFFHAEKRGYSGVALLVRNNLKYQIYPGINIPEFDFEGRTISVEHDDFILINGYYPNGQRDHNRVPFKLKFSEEMLALANNYRKMGKDVILCGDFNTAHNPIDLANPKTNKNTTGFLEIERQFIDRLLDNGYEDVFRIQNPDKNGHYTWWTYRNNCREKNVGWRIDYFFTLKQSKKQYKAEIQKNVFGSDHCPITLEF